MTSKKLLGKLYDRLKREAGRDLIGDPVSTLLSDLTKASLEEVSQWRTTRLESRIPSKQYFVFQMPGQKETSGPINQKLFAPEVALEHVEEIFGGVAGRLQPDVLRTALYTLAISYCAVTDVHSKNRNKKSPARFFEVLVGHLVASTYGTRPRTKIPVLNLDLQTELPTDYVFDFGEDRAKLHLPIKISTRERIIQAWAHQRLLDGVYGTNRFRGVLACLTETNKQAATNSVVEVCLPRQWQLYQMYIAQLWRIYYFDIPQRYLEIHAQYPFIQVKHFAEFFGEKDALISAPPG